MYIFKQVGTFFRGGRATEFKKEHIQDFIRFIRPKISLFIAGIAVSGHLMFNPLDIKLVPVFLCAFFAAVGAYTYNQLTDKREDLINKERINPFAVSESAPVFVIVFFSLSFVFALFLSGPSVLICVVWLAIGAAYSAVRVKEIFPVKNIYTALFIPLGFMVGAASNSQFTAEMVMLFLTTALLVFVVSLIGDLRDFEGDRATGIRTAPVVLGYGEVRTMASAVLFLFLASVIFLGNPAFYTLMPFASIALLFLVKNDLLKARIFILSSFVFLPLFLMSVKIFG